MNIYICIYVYIIYTQKCAAIINSQKVELKDSSPVPAKKNPLSRWSLTILFPCPAEKVDIKWHA